MYTSVLSGGFVWDDRFYLYNRAWLREGDQWLSIVAHGFPDWRVYFRPLGIALWTAMLRLFDADPLPMHAASILMHLLNTTLVGTIARRLIPYADDKKSGWLFVLIAMAIFGLHPALIEPVAWISSQFDLMVVSLSLLGMLANVCIERDSVRAIAVASCFFLAACSKESAISFPFLIFILDSWMSNAPNALARRRNWMRQFPVYVGVIVAGGIYLGLRAWGLSVFAESGATAIGFSVGQLHLAALTYLAYWKILLWPMTGGAPMHLAPVWWSDHNVARLIAIDLAALAILATAIFLFWRKSPFGMLMLAFTVAVAPTLHLVIGGLGESFYHERYAALGIAAACVFLPVCLSSFAHRLSRFARAMLAVGAAFWLILAMVDIHVTLPLWADEVRLWKWAVADDPRNAFAKDALLSTYIERGNVRDAQPLADQLLTEARDCTKCMLNVAFLSVMTGDARRAADALEAAHAVMERGDDNRALQVSYRLTLGKLLELENDLNGAEAAYRAAIALDPASPEALMNLALLQIREGDVDAAAATAQASIDLSPAALKAARKTRFDAAMTAVKTRSRAEPDSPRPNP